MVNEISMNILILGKNLTKIIKVAYIHITVEEYANYRLNMEVDLQSLFGLNVTWCAQLYSLAGTPQPPYSPALGLVYEVAIGQQSA